MFMPSLFTLAALAGSVVSLTVNTPTNWLGNTTNVVTWTSTPSDPAVFTIELVNSQFNPSIGVANNVQTSLGSVGVPLPRLTAGNDFTLQFVAVSNISDVLAMSSPFAIMENDVNGASSASQPSISAASTAPGVPGASITNTTPPGASATAPTPSTSTPTDTSAPNSSSGSSTSSGGSSPSPSPFTGGASHPAAVSSVLIAALAGMLFAN